jgi:hypothetical protein
MFVALLLFASIQPYSQQTPIADKTFSKVLGNETIKKIVIDVLDERIASGGPVPLRVPKRVKLEYDEEFVTVVTERILQVEVPPYTDARSISNSAPDIRPYAEKKLREGFGAFVDNIAAFAKEKISGPIVRLTKALYDEYMKRPKNLQKCGEIPCNQPPCCRYCAPPPCKENSISQRFPCEDASSGFK